MHFFEIHTCFAWWISGGFLVDFVVDFFDFLVDVLVDFPMCVLVDFFCGPNTYVLICIWAQKKSTEKSTRKFITFFRVHFSASWSLNFSAVGGPPRPTQEPPRLPTLDHYLHDLYSQ